MSDHDPEPLIVNFAPTGMVPTRGLSPHVPLTPAEIVADVCRAAERGITVAHVHARDRDGRPTHKKSVYARIIAGIRERHPEVVVCVSCSGRLTPDLEPRAEVLGLDGDLRPDMASLTLSSLNFSRGASVNPPDVVLGLAARMRDRGIVPEIEIFDLGMANFLGWLVERGHVATPAYANILVGNAASARADFFDVGLLAGRLPPGTVWSLAGLGAAQLPVAMMAVAGAPGVRIGLEDNLWLDARRTRLARNDELVEQVHRLADLAGRPVMPAAEFRRRLLAAGPRLRVHGGRAA